jgi:hypothetical protein
MVAQVVWVHLVRSSILRTLTVPSHQTSKQRDELYEPVTGRNARRKWRNTTEGTCAMKLCRRCNQTKVVEEFHKRGQGRQPYCKSCKREIDDQYWKENSVRLSPIKKAWRQASSAFYISLKDSKACTDCGVSYPHYILQWDHAGTDKVMNPSATRYRGEEAILKEINKCELVCANCHAARTWKRLRGVGESAVSA